MPTDKPVALFLALAASPASRPLFHRLRHDEEAFLPHMDKFYLTQIGTNFGPPRHHRRCPLNKFVVLSEVSLLSSSFLVIWWWLTPQVTMPFIKRIIIIRELSGYR
jgi:hypothetical protein